MWGIVSRLCGLGVGSWGCSYCGGLDARDVEGGEGGVGFGYAAGEVDGAGGVFDDYDLEAEVLAVDGGEADAEVVGEAAEEEAGEFALAEVSGEAGGGDVIVFEEGGVGVDVGAEALAEDEFGLREVEGGVEGCAVGVLDGVIGPEGLGAVGGFYGFVGLFGVGGGEGDVIFGVPVLGEDYVGEFCGEGVDGGDDCVAFFYRQGSAGAEVVLDVDDQKRV